MYGLWIIYILHRNTTWKHQLSSVFYFISPGMNVHSTSVCCCSEENDLKSFEDKVIKIK